MIINIGTKPGKNGERHLTMIDTVRKEYLFATCFFKGMYAEVTPKYYEKLMADIKREGYKEL